METAGKELSELIADIQSKEDLVQFVALLRDDLIQNPESWENSSLERFFEAMGAWMTDADDDHRKMGQGTAMEPSWKSFAAILYASKIYE